MSHTPILPREIRERERGCGDYGPTFLALHTLLQEFNQTHPMTLSLDYALGTIFVYS